MGMTMTMSVTRADLDPSGRRIERMWREGAPRRAAEMEAAGTFFSFLLELQEQEERLYGNLIESGMPANQAREMMFEASSPPVEDDET
jgi:hypothetical protein